MIFAMLFLQNPFVAQAAITPTVKCTKLGQTIIWRNRKYTCIRSGKKLLWDKGVEIPTLKKTVSTPTTQASIYTPPPIEFLICASNDLKLNKPISFQNPSLNEPSRGYIVVRREREIVAFSNRCTHEGGEVEVSKGELICFRHLSYFDAGNGHVLSGPATRELQSYRTSEHDSKVFVIDTP